MAESKPKTRLLEMVYEQLDDEQWSRGLELYQDDQVENIKVFGDLFTSDVGNLGPGSKLQVRIKRHPSGQFLQWIECSCPQYRRTGEYCSHIAASLFAMHQEYIEFIEKLDRKMPLKPLITSRRRGSLKQKPKPSNSEKKKSPQDDPKSMLAQLQPMITSASLPAGGPNVRLELEIKSGQKQTMDLDVDASAQFLLDNTRQTPLRGNLQNMIVTTAKFLIGTLLEQQTDESIRSTKILSVPSVELGRSERSIRDHARRLLIYSVNDQGTATRGVQTILIPYPRRAHYVGKKYAFIRGIGYLAIDTSQLSSTWYERPTTKLYTKDAAAWLIEREYGDIHPFGPTWIDRTLKDTTVVSPTIKSIHIEKESKGWFHLDPIYSSGNSEISMVEMIHQYRQRQRSFVKHGQKWVRIPDFVSEKEWVIGKSDQAIKASPLELIRLNAELDDKARFTGNSSLVESLSERISFDPQKEQSQLKDLVSSLRKYQVVGVKWLWWLYQNGLHGMLADDMGLGKTHQAMAIMSAIKKQSRKRVHFLIVCPTSVLDHWETKLHDYAPDLVTAKYHGPKRHSQGLKAHTEVVVTSYGVLLRDIKHLESIPWSVTILDEAHYVKNDTATFRAACRLRSQLRLCLTGTPMENHLKELKNLYDFLVPGYLGSDQHFRREYIAPIEQQDHAKEAELLKLISPLKLRRTKEQVLSDLPPKVEDIRYCGLSADQTKLYRGIIDERARPLIKLLRKEEGPIPFLHVFATLQLLKQVCNHPALVQAGSDYRTYQSAKFDLLSEILHEALDSQNKVVIFSQYIGMIHIIRQYLSERGIGHAVLTGQTTNRGQVIHDFQENPDTRVFIGSLLAGGIGIDLTAASVVIHYDRWWNASKENQATDRVHRIGQKRFVQVFKLVTRGTLEEKIDALISRKSKLFERFVERDDEIFKTMGREELIHLLEP